LASCVGCHGGEGGVSGGEPAGAGAALLVDDDGGVQVVGVGELFRV
jgi:hypothetical protein